MKLSAREMRELVELDALCFEPPINYTLRDIRAYTSGPGVVLLREYTPVRLIGFCLGDSETGQITTLDVHPDHRGKGLGRLLLGKMIEEFKRRKTTKAISQVAIDNEKSLRLHQKMGFEIKYILYGYYPNGSAAFELELPLNDK